MYAYYWPPEQIPSPEPIGLSRRQGIGALADVQYDEPFATPGMIELPLPAVFSTQRVKTMAVLKNGDQFLGAGIQDRPMIDDRGKAIEQILIQTPPGPQRLWDRQDLSYAALIPEMNILPPI
jgi:hypothetical protein